VAKSTSIEAVEFQSKKQHSHAVLSAESGQSGLAQSRALVTASEAS
jgi:hypothetical protein